MLASTAGSAHLQADWGDGDFAWPSCHNPLDQCAVGRLRESPIAAGEVACGTRHDAQLDACMVSVACEELGVNLMLLMMLLPALGTSFAVAGMTSSNGRCQTRMDV